MWNGPSSNEEVKVPNLIGLTATTARDVAVKAGLVITAEDPDGPPFSALTWHGIWLVTAQHPAAGTAMRRYGSVVVDFRAVPGNEAGDREPRFPLPPLDVLGGERDLAEDAD
jgi:hypothetical protein